MLPASLYRGPRNGDTSNSEAQFQGRVVENAWVNQHEILVRKHNANIETYAKPYARTSAQGPEICTLKTNEICVKPRLGSKNNSKDYEDLYQPGQFDIVGSGDDNGYPYILSAMNGEYITNMTQAQFDALTYEEQRAVVRNKWQLAGIVGTNNDSLGFHGEIGRPDLPVQLGGVYTISNFGEKPIFQGDLVVWNAPVIKYSQGGATHAPPHCDETPDEKCVIATEPYNAADVFGWHAVKDKLRRLNGMNQQDLTNEITRLVRVSSGDNSPHSQLDYSIAMLLVTATKLIMRQSQIQWNAANEAAKVLLVTQAFGQLNPNAMENILEPFFIALAEQRAEYNSRIVGRALTTALPGNNFNIYMGNYCV